MSNCLISETYEKGSVELEFKINKFLRLPSARGKKTLPMGVFIGGEGTPIIIDLDKEALETMSKIFAIAAKQMVKE